MQSVSMPLGMRHDLRLRRPARRRRGAARPRASLGRDRGPAPPRLPRGEGSPGRGQIEVAPYGIEGCPFRLRLDVYPASDDGLSELVALPEAPDTEQCLSRGQAKLLETFGPHPWWDHEGGYRGGVISLQHTGAPGTVMNEEPPTGNEAEPPLRVRS